MSTEKKFDVAFSFAGEDREYVNKVAEKLKEYDVKVFYDKFEELDLWGKDLYVYLSDIYQNRASFTVIFISNHYASKLWTNHERKSAQARAFTEKKEYILPVRFDDTEIPGILPTTGYIDLRYKSPIELADIIRRKIIQDHEFPGDKKSEELNANLAESSQGGLVLSEKLKEDLIKVEGGIFRIGSTEYDNEKPVHKVSLSSFYISKYAVTVIQFKDFIDATAYVTDAKKEGWSYIYIGGSWEKKSGINWACNVRGKKRTNNEYNHPVIHVSWNDAVAYCKWVDGRLPTEAEWEYAARGGNKSQGFKYAGSDNPDEVAWYKNNSGTKTHPVGLKKANEIGLFDMSGNVWEWCHDWFAADYYSNSPVDNPYGPSTGTLKVLRGGTWHYNSDAIRPTNRDYDIPNSRGSNTGFRVAA